VYRAFANGEPLRQGMSTPMGGVFRFSVQAAVQIRFFIASLTGGMPLLRVLSGRIFFSAKTAGHRNGIVNTVE
jgi:hypothetical protein